MCGYFLDYDIWHFSVNVIVLFVILLPKFPEMHKVRIGGLNKGPEEE